MTLDCSARYASSTRTTSPGRFCVLWQRPGTLPRRAAFGNGAADVRRQDAVDRLCADDDRTGLQARQHSAARLRRSLDRAGASERPSGGVAPSAGAPRHAPPASPRPRRRRPSRSPALPMSRPMSSPCLSDKASAVPGADRRKNPDFRVARRAPSGEVECFSTAVSGLR